MLSTINAIILIAIAGIHFYWAFGGRWGANAAIPEIEGLKAFKPGPFATAIVAIAFLGFASLYLVKINVINIPYPTWILKYGILILAGIFLVRAIGDFKYVGFLKSIKESQFADLDTKYYSPLCLFLGINSLIIEFLFKN
jgi:Protein of unknown function (DUF3995)